MRARHAREIRAGLAAARLPHALRAAWIYGYGGGSPLALRAYSRTAYKSSEGES